MKKEFIWIIAAFIIGILIGGAIVWKCGSGCCKTSCSDKECIIIKPSPYGKNTATIDTIAANSYYHAYLGAPVSIDTLKAFTINLEQFYAMGKILNADSTVHGFRIYMGADGSPAKPVMMVVGTGSPDKTGSIYLTSAIGSGPCPIICDVSSPIIK